MQKDKIGPYKIMSKAGEGAFGIVWMTESSKDNKNYAIKEISKKRMTPQLMENLVREVHISFNLKHKNIIKCYNTLESKNNYYIIFEYCSGGDLEKYMKRLKKIELGDALYFMRQIRDAYRYLLSQNILHRDIKLENILLEDDKNYVVKLSDFGCSKVDPIGTTICGTPKYMALEVMESENNYDYKADLWSIGLCFWELIFGIESFPFSQKSREALKNDIKKSSGANLKFPKLPQLPEVFYEFFRSILNVSPKLRMDANEFVNHPIFDYEPPTESMINAMKNMKINNNNTEDAGNDDARKSLQTTAMTMNTQNGAQVEDDANDGDKTKAFAEIKKFYNTKILEINLIKATCVGLKEYVKAEWDKQYTSYYKCLLIILLKKALVKAEVSFKSLDTGTNSFKLQKFDDFIKCPNEYILLKEDLLEVMNEIKRLDDEIYSQLIHECYTDAFLQEINSTLYMGTNSDAKTKFIGSVWKYIYNKFKSYIEDYEQQKFEKLLLRVSLILKGKVVENLNAFY